MPPRMHLVTLAFEDAELERGFRRKSIHEAHARHTLTWALIAASTAALAAIDGLILEPERLHAIWEIRYLGLLPILIGVALFGLVSE